MKTSDNGLHLIKQFEGCKLTAYKCPAGIWTIGVGHTGGVTPGMTITQAKADELLRKDVERFEKAVNAYVAKLGLNQNQFDALVSFTFNGGEGMLQTLCKNRNAKQIADALLLYNKGGGKVLPGLVKRREAEKALFVKPVTTQPTKPTDPNALPYKVKTKCDLNIRAGAGVTFAKIRVAKAGEVLTVWAIDTNDETKWGKNGKEYFSLSYCERI